MPSNRFLKTIQIQYFVWKFRFWHFWKSLTRNSGYLSLFCCCTETSQNKSTLRRKKVLLTNIFFVSFANRSRNNFVLLVKNNEVVDKYKINILELWNFTGTWITLLNISVFISETRILVEFVWFTSPANFRRSIVEIFANFSRYKCEKSRFRFVDVFNQ